MNPMTENKSRRQWRVCFMIDSLQPAGTESKLLALNTESGPLSSPSPPLVYSNGESELSRSLEPALVRVLRLGVKGLDSAQSFPRAWRFELARLLHRQTNRVCSIFLDSTYFGVPVGV